MRRTVEGIRGKYKMALIFAAIARHFSRDRRSGGIWAGFTKRN